MKRRQLGPEYDNFMRLDRPMAQSSLAGRVIGALKPGAFMAIAVALVFIYLDTFAGIRLDQRLTGSLVLVALTGPAVVALVFGLRARQRQAAARPPDEPPPPAA